MTASERARARSARQRRTALLEKYRKRLRKLQARLARQQLEIRMLKIKRAIALYHHPREIERMKELIRLLREKCPWAR